ncbi:MAG: ribosome assembly RNA-binding protein YhbY [Gemmatimonadaceae bacterium]|nr:ribosome assembly RNA-binding protein YhbY [Gemmatimonadaceae bacterium]
MTITSKERAALRAEAHHLAPLVHVGHQGLTETLLKSVDDALRTHELVKVALSRTTDAKPKDAAHQLAESLGADVVQTIGRTCTLFRENPELKRKKGDPPPWRQN